MNFVSRRIRVLAIPVATSLLLAACGSDDKETSAATDSTAATDSGGDAATELTGEIFVTGSSTVEPISVAVGEAFGAARGVTPSVEGPGTGDGFKKFCAGEADIADASRKIKDEEIAACEKAGVTYTELEIGLDALTVMTSAENDAISCLTFDDLYGLVGPESEGVAKWSDAKAKGATSDLPDAELSIFAPGTESGTYDSFWELAIKKKAEEALGKDKAEEQKLRPDYGGLANDNEITDSIASNPTSFGWVGFAFAEEATGIKEIEIDGGDGCVAPSAATVGDKSYPLSRGLFIYVSNEKLASNPALGEFVDYYLSDEGIAAVTEVGYVALPDETLAATRATWEAAK